MIYQPLLLLDYQLTQNQANYQQLDNNCESRLLSSLFDNHNKIVKHA